LASLQTTTTSRTRVPTPQCPSDESIAAAVAYDRDVAFAIGHILDAANDAGVVRIAVVTDHHADNLAGAFEQRAGQCAGHVTELVRNGLDASSGRFADLVAGGRQDA
jgi:hypothetical protein